MKTDLPDLESLMDTAEIRYLLDSEVRFSFAVRRPSGSPDYYERLDRELRGQILLKVHSFRMVKEGWTKISRPAEIGFELEDLLQKRPELRARKARVDQLLGETKDFDLLGFLRANRDLLSQIDLLASCLDVMKFLIQNRFTVQGLLPRQIPHGQSTKLIGRENILLRLFSYWRGHTSTWQHFFDYFLLLDKPAEFRFFSPLCLCQGKPLQSLQGVLASQWQEQFDFKSLRGTLIVENIETFYDIARSSRESLVIWGAGWKVAQLKPLVHLLPPPIFYWGDIDKEGYEIYGFLKKIVPSLQSVLMGQETIDKNKNLIQSKDPYVGPFRLVEDLQNEYEQVCLKGWQIEQEQIKEQWPFHPLLN